MTDMMPFTVEAVACPVYCEDDWSPLREVTDLIPGSFLIEDPEQPTLVMSVTSSSAMRAALFVDGVFKLVGLGLMSLNSVRPAEPDDDCHWPLVLSPDVEARHEWAESVELAPCRNCG
jgi:hypothetical protein